MSMGNNSPRCTRFRVDPVNSVQHWAEVHEARGAGSAGLQRTWGYKYRRRLGRRPIPATMRHEGNGGKRFNDPQLNGLEEQVNISNQNIAAAAANVVAARAMIREARAHYFPSISANPGITNSRLSTLSGRLSAILSQRTRCRWRLPGNRICGAVFETP